jgi:hypothetical protein
LPEGRYYKGAFVIPFGDIYTLAVKFHDEPNVIHFLKMAMDTKSPPRSLDFNHPRLNKVVKVIFRGVSSRGKKIYRYSEGTKEGSILGG